MGQTGQIIKIMGKDKTFQQIQEIWEIKDGWEV